jgi:hypothetical protein
MAVLALLLGLNYSVPLSNYRIVLATSICGSTRAIARDLTSRSIVRNFTSRSLTSLSLLLPHWLQSGG